MPTRATSAGSMGPWRSTREASVGPSAYSYRRHGGRPWTRSSSRRWKAGCDRAVTRPASSARRRAVWLWSDSAGRATLAATGHQWRVDQASHVSHRGPPPSRAQACRPGTISSPARKLHPGLSCAGAGEIGTANGVRPSRSSPATSVLGLTSLRLGGRLHLLGGEDPYRALHAALLVLFVAM